MGKNFRETLNSQLNNPEFKAEWEASEAEIPVLEYTAKDCKRVGNEGQG